MISLYILLKLGILKFNKPTSMEILSLIELSRGKRRWNCISWFYHKPYWLLWLHFYLFSNSVKIAQIATCLRFCCQFQQVKYNRTFPLASPNSALTPGSFRISLQWSYFISLESQLDHLGDQVLPSTFIINARQRAFCLYRSLCPLTL